MNCKKYAIYLVSSILLLSTGQSKACGFYESEGDYRAMMFNVSLPSFRPLDAFNYVTSLDYYRVSGLEFLISDPNQRDRYKNCTEWLAACQNKPLIEDIYKIQYQADPEIFLDAYDNNTLNNVYEGNTFIKYLTDKKNKELLDYMVFAKKAEYNEIGVTNRFEYWDNRYDRRDTQRRDMSRKLTNQAEQKLDTKLSAFLKSRYAFQLCRLYYYGSRPSLVIETYDKYFGKIDKNNLMSVWAGLFRAMTTPEDDADRYKLLVQVFNNCDEKKFRCVQLLPSKFDQSALTPQEQSTAILMQALTNSGRALDQIKEAYSLDKTNPNIAFLVFREMNKLEDWMITPLFYGRYSITNSNPLNAAIPDWNETDQTSGEDNNSDNVTDIAENDSINNNDSISIDAQYQKENLMTDLQYMENLKSFLISILPTSSGDTKDFYAISLAHISLLQENTADAKKYMAMVSDKANPSILLQKKIETIWLAIKTEDIYSDKFKKIYLDNIKDLERVSSPSFDNNKMLYTLILTLANEYIKKGDYVYGNLLRMKSDSSKNPHGWYTYYNSMYLYGKISYFDENSKVEDVDRLIGLFEKAKKTPFDEYLCSDYVPYIDAYKELKGTMAFRDGDLQLAYDTFSSMPSNYWQTGNFSFRNFLNEDPFIPKGLNSNKSRHFDYKFNKATFVKEIMQLQEKIMARKSDKTADYYNKLGDAFFNTSYWGNSWMMTRYSWSVGDEYYTKTDKLPIWMQNYLTASQAKSYYEKALQTAVNNDQKAYATIMLAYISRLNYDYKSEQASKDLVRSYLAKLQDYAYTDTYKHYSSNCSMIRKGK